MWGSFLHSWNGSSLFLEEELTQAPDMKGMSSQSITSIISTNLGPFGANSVITFGVSFSIRW